MVFFNLIGEVFEINKLELVSHFFGLLLETLVLDEGGEGGNEGDLHKDILLVLLVFWWLVL